MCNLKRLYNLLNPFFIYNIKVKRKQAEFWFVLFCCRFLPRDLMEADQSEPRYESRHRKKTKTGRLVYVWQTSNRHDD